MSENEIMTSDDTLVCNTCYSKIDIEDIPNFSGTCPGITYTCPICGIGKAEFEEITQYSDLSQTIPA